MISEFITPSVPNTTVKIYETNIRTEEMFFDWHIHSEYEMFMVQTGQKVFYGNEGVYVLNEGDIIFVNKNVPHKTATPIGSSGILLQFKQDSSENESEFHTYMREIIQSHSKAIVKFEYGTTINKNIKDCIHKIVRENKEQDRAFDMFVRTYIQEIIGFLCRDNVLFYPSEIDDYKDFGRLMPVLSFVEKHYSEQISLDTVSAFLHIDKAHFCRIFKKIMERTFVDYLNCVRIKHAEQLLKRTEKSVTDISYMVGFSSPAYFIKQFVNSNCCTPLKYRKMYRDGKRKELL